MDAKKGEQIIKSGNWKTFETEKNCLGKKVNLKKNYNL